MNLKLKKFDKGIQEWNRLIGSFTGYDIHQSWEWGKVMEKWGWEIERIVIHDNEETVAATSVQIKRKLGYFFCYLPRGPLITPVETSVLREVIKQLKSYYSSAFFIRINPWIEFKDDIAAVMYKSGRPNKEKALYDTTLIIDLNKDEDELWMEIRKGNRSYITKAAKELDIRNVEFSDKKILEFCKLHKNMSETKKLRIQDSNFFLSVIRSLRESNKIKLRAVFNGDKMLAGTILFLQANRVCYKWGASISSKETGFYASHFLQWDNILWAKNMNYSEYDLGGYIPDSKTGVSLFKKGFGGSIKRLVGEYDIVNNMIFYSMYKKYIKYSGA